MLHKVYDYITYNVDGYSDDYSDGSYASNYESDAEPSSGSVSSSSAPAYDEPSVHPQRNNVTGGSTEGHVEKKDWNKEFQMLVEQQDSELKFKKLSHLSRDFVHAAQSYAIIIINELCLPHDEKTIKVKSSLRWC